MRADDEDLEDETPEHMGRRFGLAMKVFGVISIASGVQNVATYVFVTLLLGLAIAGGFTLERYNTVTALRAALMLVDCGLTVASYDC